MSPASFANFHPFYRKTPTFGRKGHFVKKLLSQVILHTWPLPMIRAPPLLKFGFTPASYQISEESEATILRTRYFRKRDPHCKPEAIEWIEMSGSEYYRFVTDPKNNGRYFLNMGDVVLECTKAEYKRYKAEDDHSSYILEQETDWITLSLEAAAVEKGICREELIADMAQDVEDEAIRRIEITALHSALAQLDTKSYQLISALYALQNRKTERELAMLEAVSQNTIHKQKEKILKTLKILVVKFQKSSQ